MKEEYVLPENWCIKVTNENRDIINNWKLSINPGSNNLFEYLSIEYVSNIGRGLTGWSRVVEEISFNDFCKYVLKKEIKEEIIDNDNSYLIEVLNKLKIK